MPFLLAEILNFQGSTHRIGVGSFSQKFSEAWFSDYPPGSLPVSAAAWCGGHGMCWKENRKT